MFFFVASMGINSFVCCLGIDESYAIMMRAENSELRLGAVAYMRREQERRKRLYARGMAFDGISAKRKRRRNLFARQVSQSLVAGVGVGT